MVSVQLLSFVLSRRSLLRLTSWAIQTYKPRRQLSWTEQTCWSETAQTWLMGVLPTAPLSQSHALPRLPGVGSWFPVVINAFCDSLSLWILSPWQLKQKASLALGAVFSLLLLDSTDLPEVLVAPWGWPWKSWPFYCVLDFRNHLKLWPSPGLHRCYKIIFLTKHLSYFQLKIASFRNDMWIPQ